MPTPLSTLLERPDKPKDDSKIIKGQIKCKWFVSISLVIFRRNFALKPEIREFYG